MPDSDPTTSVEFRTIARFPGYRFGSDGTFWSRWTRVWPKGSKAGGSKFVLGEDWHQLSPMLGNRGYLLVALKDDFGKMRTYAAHRIILEAFVGPRPDGMVARHLDGCPTNNRTDNLQWSTQKVNIGDKRRHGTLPVGSRHHRAKLTEAQVIEIRAESTRGATRASLAEKYAVSPKTIGYIVQRRIWKSVDG